MKQVWEMWKTFWKEDKGIGTLEMIMIIAVIVLIAFAFRKWILKWVADLFNSTDQNINQFKNDVPGNLHPAAGVLFVREQGHA